MSQGVGFGEQELVEGLQSSINLRLDKDSLIKPSRDVVMEIYGRFLDVFRPKWRDLNPDQELVPIVELCKHMRLLMKTDPGIEVEFGFDDLNHPTRRRTNLFIAALIHLKDEFDEWSERKKMDLAAKSEKQDKLEHVAQDIVKLQQLRDELAYKIGRADRARLMQIHEQRKLTLKEGQRLCEEVDFSAKELKAKLVDSKELLRQRTQMLQQIQEQLDQKNAAKTLANEWSELQEVESKLTKELENLRIQTANSVKSARNESEKKKQDLLDAIQSRKNETAKLKATIVEIRRKRAEILEHRKKNTELVETAIKRESKQLESFKKKYEESREGRDEIEAIISSYCSKLNQLVGGKSKPVKQLPQVAPSTVHNDTYIKSSSLAKSK